jgi:hypothetical protein
LLAEREQTRKERSCSSQHWAPSKATRCGSSSHSDMAPGGGSTTSKLHSNTLLRTGTHAQQVRNEPSNSATAATRCTTRCAACRHTGLGSAARRAALCASTLRASELRAVQLHPEQGQLAQQHAAMRAGTPPARQRWREHTLRAGAVLRSTAGAQTLTGRVGGLRAWRWRKRKQCCCGCSV